MTVKIPEDFNNVMTTPPDHRNPVLALIKSPISGYSFEVVTVRYDPFYRPQDPWMILNSSSSLSEFGIEILAWKEFPQEWR